MRKINLDIAIFGGGISGLWLLQTLIDAGYNVHLFESNCLGSDQTIASQGIIHGGMKYALNGILSEASESIKDMPIVWQQHFDGLKAPDLSAVNILSDSQLLISQASIMSRLAGFFASKLLESRIRLLPENERPSFLRNNQFAGSTYELLEKVLDVHSLLNVMSANVKSNISSYDESSLHILDKNNYKFSIGKYEISSGAIILTAGGGNISMAKSWGINQVSHQTRPLHMVTVSCDQLGEFFGHILGSGSLPMITITSGKSDSGNIVWYMGGEVAEKGIAMKSADLIDYTRSKLSSIFPWIDFSRSKWSTFRVDRIEPQTPNTKRPEKPVVYTYGKLLIGWPIKLAFAPLLACNILNYLSEMKIAPSGALNEIKSVVPDIAPRPW